MTGGMSEWLSDAVIGWVMQWVNEWCSDWVSAWCSERVSEWCSEWVMQWVSEWMSEWVDEWVSDAVSEWVSEWCSEWVGVWAGGIDREREREIKSVWVMRCRGSVREREGPRACIDLYIKMHNSSAHFTWYCYILHVGFVLHTMDMETYIRHIKHSIAEPRESVSGQTQTLNPKTLNSKPYYKPLNPIDP